MSDVEEDEEDMGGQATLASPSLSRSGRAGNDSDSESMRSSSSDEEEKVDLDAQNIRLAQMRRTARAKTAGKSKLLDKFAGLQSYEEMRKEHGLQRMVDGVTVILKLHTPYELSSICGVLGLPVKEKASTSIKMIVNYCQADGNLQSVKLNKLLETFWEGPLWEYLRSIGHPSSTMFLDPKKTVLKVWEEGGVLGGEGSFVPHFLVREVKKRYEWIKSKDVLEKLEKLRLETEACKRHEMNMVSDHDFTHIVKFLKAMKELRSTEEMAREYLIGELESCRARLDSVDEVLRMSRQDMADLERQLVVLTDALNERYAYLEFAAESKSLLLEKKDMELHRLILIVDSYIETHKDRMTPGGGGMQALKLREPEDCTKLARDLLAKLTTYRDLRDSNDDELRERCREHIDYIDLLEDRLRKTEEKAEYEIRRANREEQRAVNAERDVRFCVRKIMEMNLREQATKTEAWQSSTRWMLRTLDCENRLRRSKRLLAAGIQDSDRTIVRYSTALNGVLDAINGDELKELHETVAMARADAFSARFRKFAKEEEERKRRGGKPKKTVVSSSKPQDAKEDDSKIDEEASEVTKTSKASKGSKGGKSKGGGKGGGKSGGGDKAKGDKKAAPAKASPAKASPAKGKKK